MKILLLGNTGFVGKNVADVLRESDIGYVGLSKSTGLDLRSKSESFFYFNQIKPDLIINCAAHVGSLNYVTKQAANIIKDNVEMIIGMYDCVANCCPHATIINPIANCVYPATSNIFIEDELWNGHLHRSVLAYGATRRLLLNLAESYQMQHHIKTINLLVPNMYGPYDSADPNKAHALNALISKFVKAQKENQQELVIWGTGIAIREWLYAKDFGEIILQIIKNPNLIGLSEPLNIAQNFGLSVKELVDIISRKFDYQGQITWDHNMPDGAQKKVMDDRRFKKVFNTFEFTDFDRGIAKTIEYYNNIYPY